MCLVSCDYQGGNAEKFKLIATAYHILSDPVERQKYDLTNQYSYTDDEFDAADEANMEDFSSTGPTGGPFAGGPYAGGPYTGFSGFGYGRY